MSSSNSAHGHDVHDKTTASPPVPESIKHASASKKERFVWPKMTKMTRRIEPGVPMEQLYPRFLRKDNQIDLTFVEAMLSIKPFAAKQGEKGKSWNLVLTRCRAQQPHLFRYFSVNSARVRFRAYMQFALQHQDEMILPPSGHKESIPQKILSGIQQMFKIWKIQKMAKNKTYNNELGGKAADASRPNKAALDSKITQKREPIVFRNSDMDISVSDLSDDTDDDNDSSTASCSTETIQRQLNALEKLLCMFISSNGQRSIAFFNVQIQVLLSHIRTLLESRNDDDSVVLEANDTIDAFEKIIIKKNQYVVEDLRRELEFDKKLLARQEKFFEEQKKDYQRTMSRLKEMQQKIESMAQSDGKI
jgi:hypothetical protein